MSWRVKAPNQSYLDVGPPQIVAGSTAMMSVVAEARRLASQDCPVLIHGETGTGKELIARLVHGERGPFVVIDCTHLSPQLAESELFGHARGAYTGADAERSGLIEAAHGGTAFFDEVGELSLEVQAKLLRLLQQKTYRRLGSSHEQRSEFRIIAATNRDLKRESQAGRFRQDLYYRLNVAKIRIPALRERKEDIPFLVRHFLQSTGLEAAPEVIEIFLRYHWPGNVRELENCIRRMVVHSQGNWLSPSHVPPTVCADAVQLVPQLIRMTAAIKSTDREAPADIPQQDAELQPLPLVPLIPLHKLESLAILRALRETSGDRSRAAALLGIGRTTLYRKMQEMEKDQALAVALRQWTDQ